MKDRILWKRSHAGEGKQHEEEGVVEKCMLVFTEIIFFMVAYMVLFRICDENSVDNGNALLLHSAMPVPHPHCAAHGRGGGRVRTKQ